MNTIIIVAVSVVVGLAITWWRLTGPGKRLRFGALNLYFPPTVTVDEAKRVGEYLRRENFAATPTDARLTREGKIYQLQLIWSLDPQDENQALACEVLAAGLTDDEFAGATVEVHICDTIFRPISVVRHRGRFGRRIRMNAAHLFYLGGVTDVEAFEVATFLAAVGVFDDEPKIAQMDRNTQGFEFRLAVKVDPLTPELVQGEGQMANDLSQVLKGGPVTVRFCKGLLGTLRTILPGTLEPAAENSPRPAGPFQTEVYHVPGERTNGNHLREENGDR